MPLDFDQIEKLERTAFEIVVQALLDYRSMASLIFREETDLPQDIAEDITREAIESMGVSSIKERLYGKVDVKKAIYVFLPEAQPVALMVDAKAEKGNGSATIQMSQTSMIVKMMRGRPQKVVEEPGKLEMSIVRDGRKLHVVTIIVKFVYGETDSARWLEKIIVSCIPNGRLQEFYNPTPTDTIWRAGRNAPTLGEDFRVRLSYHRLVAKRPWRVREIKAAE